MIESLYFLCYYAYLKGDLQQATIFYDLLKEEFKAAGNPGALKDYQYSELLKVKLALATGNMTRTQWLDEPCPQGPPTQSTAVFDQDELVRKIDQNSGQLKSILQDEISLYNLEHPCDPYGQVDMVYAGSRTIYPLEVKKDQGRHDLIGQIMKYDLYHKLRLHYKHYDFVQSVTICSSYEPYTLKELKQLGIITIVYTYLDAKFSLKLL